MPLNLKGIRFIIIKKQISDLHIDSPKDFVKLFAKARDGAITDSTFEFESEGNFAIKKSWINAQGGGLGPGNVDSVDVIIDNTLFNTTLKPMYLGHRFSSKIDANSDVIDTNNQIKSFVNALSDITGSQKITAGVSAGRDITGEKLSNTIKAELITSGDVRVHEQSLHSYMSADRDMMTNEIFSSISQQASASASAAGTVHIAKQVIHNTMSAGRDMINTEDDSIYLNEIVVFVGGGPFTFVGNQHFHNTLFAGRDILFSPTSFPFKNEIVSTMLGQTIKSPKQDYQNTLSSGRDLINDNNLTNAINLLVLAEEHTQAKQHLENSLSVGRDFTSTFSMNNVIDVAIETGTIDIRQNYQNVMRVEGDITTTGPVFNNAVETKIDAEMTKASQVMSSDMRAGGSIIANTLQADVAGTITNRVSSEIAVSSGATGPNTQNLKAVIKAGDDIFGTASVNPETSEQQTNIINSVNASAPGDEAKLLKAFIFAGDEITGASNVISSVGNNYTQIAKIISHADGVDLNTTFNNLNASGNDNDLKSLGETNDFLSVRVIGLNTHYSGNTLIAGQGDDEISLKIFTGLNQTISHTTFVFKYDKPTQTGSGHDVINNYFGGINNTIDDTENTIKLINYDFFSLQEQDVNNDNQADLVITLIKGDSINDPSNIDDDNTITLMGISEAAFDATDVIGAIQIV